MKKLLLSLTALTTLALGANAATVVGSDDNSAAWWTAFSDYYSLTGDGSVTVNFTNYSDCANNWDNFVAVLTTDADRGATGYSEYLVLRADAYGWGDNYDSSNLKYDYLAKTSGWDYFKENMNGAQCSVTLMRKGNTVKVRALITLADDAATKLCETYEVTIADLPETVRMFLTVEKAHLEVMEPVVNSGGYVATGATGTYTGDGWETQNYFAPVLQDLYTEVYGDKVIVRDFYGVEGYDLCVYYDENGITSITQIVGGVETESANYGYYYVYTGLSGDASYTDLGFYAGSGYSYVLSGTDETSGGLLIFAYPYYGTGGYDNYGYYYMGWGADTPTGISTPVARAASSDAPAYDLAGRRVVGSPKGIVVKGGKKYMAR